jgi:DNA-directed RNA polymerase specialized sigma subunit
MTAKEYLRQAYRLNELIDSRITELERLRDYSTRLTSCSFEGERVSKSRSTEAPFARIIEKIVDLEKVINRDIDRYVDLKTEMNVAIDRVSNVDERLLLRYRYLNNYSWDDIAQLLNVSGRTVHRIHSTALYNFSVPV